MENNYSYPLAQRKPRPEVVNPEYLIEYAQRPTSPPTPRETIEKNKELLKRSWGASTPKP